MMEVFSNASILSPGAKLRPGKKHRRPASVLDIGATQSPFKFGFFNLLELPDIKKDIYRSEDQKKRK